MTWWWWGGRRQWRTAVHTKTLGSRFSHGTRLLGLFSNDAIGFLQTLPWVGTQLRILLGR
jgi:hypothetical protein